MAKRVAGGSMRKSGVGSGGGFGNRVVKHVAASKAEPKSHKMRPQGVAQIGGFYGNHSTNRGRTLTGAIERVRDGTGYATPVGPTDNVKAVGVGGGREVFRCGMQGQHGAPAGQVRPPGQDHLSQFGPSSRSWARGNNDQRNRRNEMVDVKYKNPGTPEQRIAKLQNSGRPDADVKTKQGDGPTRVFHNIHHAAGHQKLPKLPDDQQRGK